MNYITNNEKQYVDNIKYSEYLDNQDIDSFSKYVDYIIKYTKNNDFILDVGCGTGLALHLLNQKAKRNIFGIDISVTSIEKCRQKQLDCQVYNGKEIPFPNDHFNLVGSYNVLEHVDNPEQFLDEMLRVLKKEGIMILVCPNFLSITNNYHHHTRGLYQKVKNFMMIFKKLFSSHYRFEKMPTIIREDFQPDDDACNVTNPIDIFKWARKHNLELEYWSSQSVYKKGIINYLDVSFLKLFLGSSFFIFRK